MSSNFLELHNGRGVISLHCLRSLFVEVFVDFSRSFEKRSLIIFT